MFCWEFAYTYLSSFKRFEQKLKNSCPWFQFIYHSETMFSKRNPCLKFFNLKKKKNLSTSSLYSELFQKYSTDEASVSTRVGNIPLCLQK